jgi:hypothetical protein
VTEKGPPVLRKPRMGSLTGVALELPGAVDGEDALLLLILSKFFAKAETEPRLKLLSGVEEAELRGEVAAAIAVEDLKEVGSGGEAKDNDGEEFFCDEDDEDLTIGPGTGTGGVLLFRLIASCRSFIRSLSSDQWISEQTARATSE